MCGWDGKRSGKSDGVDSGQFMGFLGNAKSGMTCADCGGHVEDSIFHLDNSPQSHSSIWRTNMTLKMSSS